MHPANVIRAVNILPKEGKFGQYNLRPLHKYTSADKLKKNDTEIFDDQNKYVSDSTERIGSLLFKHALSLQR
jgi:hypothetical protein